MQIRNYGIRHKVAFMAIVLVLITSASIGGVFFLGTMDALIKHEAGKLEADTHREGAFLQGKISELTRDVQFLAKTPPHSRSGSCYQK